MLKEWAHSRSSWSKIFEILLMTNTLTYFEVDRYLVAIVFILLAVKYWSRKLAKRYHGCTLAWHIILCKIRALERLILTLDYILFDDKNCFEEPVSEWPIRAVVSDGRLFLLTVILFISICRLCVGHRLSRQASWVFVMEILRRIFIVNTEPSLFYSVSRHFLKAY